MAGKRIIYAFFKHLPPLTKPMLTNQQLRNHPDCPFQGKSRARPKIVVRLFEKTVAMAAGKKLREFACEMPEDEPFIGKTAKRGVNVLTGFIKGKNFYVGCNEKSCLLLETKGYFFLGKCKEERALGIPKSLVHAAEKEARATKRKP